MNKLKLLVRYSVFIPILALVVWLFNFILLSAILWLLSLSRFWLFVAIFSFGALVWVIFTALGTLIVQLSSYIVPDRKPARLIITIMVILFCAKYIYNLWAGNSSFDGSRILSLLFVSYMYVALASSLILGSLKDPWS